MEIKTLDLELCMYRDGFRASRFGKVDVAVISCRVWFEKKLMGLPAASG